MLDLARVAPHDWEFVYPAIYDDLMDEFHTGCQPLTAKAGELVPAQPPDEDGRDDRPVDGGLVGDISSANDIGIRGKATLLAGE